jgi:HlyD family secretion protein
MSGTVSMLRVEKGERVLGTQMMTGTEMMRIADLTRMEVEVEVNENDIVRVNLNDTASIEVDAYLGDKFTGIVTEIANAANTTGLSTDQVTNFNVKVFILQDSYQHIYEQGITNPFRPGMSATVDIETDSRYDILSVPIQAVTTRGDSTMTEETSEFTEETDETVQPETTGKETEEILRELVFVISEGKAVIKEVKSGIQDNNYIEILEGVNEGDEIITAPYTAVSKKLKDGSLVEVVPLEDLFKTDKKK